MFVPRKVAEALFTHTDGEASRYALAGIKLERKDGAPYAAASDGRRLLAVTWEEPALDAGVVECHQVEGCEVVLDAKQLKAASKALKPKKAQEKLRPACRFVTIDESTFSTKPTADQDEKGVRTVLSVEAHDGLGARADNPVESLMGRWPNWRDVQGNTDGVSITLDAKFLMEACKSLLSLCPDDESGSVSRGITLTFAEEDPDESAVTMTKKNEEVAATVIIMPLATGYKGQRGNSPAWKLDEASPFKKKEVK